MQQATTTKLYAYWNEIRNGRIAPQRFEVDPGRISALLRETFIAESCGLFAFRFRLAGTEVCQHFGRELRGIDFLSLWSLEDRRSMFATLESVVGEGAVGHGSFIGITENNREAAFEFVLLPLIHTGTSINRILGALTPIDRPFWIGADPLAALELRDIGLHWPDGAAHVVANGNAEAALEARRNFRVVQGGLPG
ncbi:MAG: PAS domain-containing protein [Methyloceanibacter sp.]|nr:PAS domain-containing protein [Methyloceanibacter sp.]